jgi:hypothetical protein
MQETSHAQKVDHSKPRNLKKRKQKKNEGRVSDENQKKARKNQNTLLSLTDS